MSIDFEGKVMHQNGKPGTDIDGKTTKLGRGKLDIDKLWIVSVRRDKWDAK